MEKSNAAPWGEKHKCFRPGQIWLDGDGEPIQAHGGGVIHHEGIYYWYGENKDGPTITSTAINRLDVIGVSCYSSKDLYNWRNEGVVLPAVPDDREHDLHPSKVVERPKVLYNENTEQFVMFMHIDTFDYKYARIGFAVSDSPTGPFQYQGSVSPLGLDGRDMTAFKDKDGKGYVIFGAEWHSWLYIAQLGDDYLKLTGNHSRHFNRAGPPSGREAPAIFQHDGLYHMITSGTTGWNPNPSEHAVAESIHGPWTVTGNPCKGEGKETSFDAQSTFVLPVVHMPGAYILMMDRWFREKLHDSRYVWLPIEIQERNAIVHWHGEWDLSMF